MVVESQGSLGKPFGYTGEQVDDGSGLVYLRARYYEPQPGMGNLGRLFELTEPISGGRVKG